MKKFLTVLTSTTLALAALSIFGLMSRQTASAKTELNLSSAPVSSVATTTIQTSGVVLPRVNIYCLTSDNMIYVLTPNTSTFRSLGRVSRANGNLIGLDFRVADRSGTSVYGLTDTGRILLINLYSTPLRATVVSTLNPRFAGGFQSLADFNPVANALRVIGSNDQNFAVVNAATGGNLNQTVPQAPLVYAAGDVNFGVDPNISAGSYTNNYVGAPNTIFYAIDYDLDTFVTIAPPLTATGSSNTGQGQLQTIGRIKNGAGNMVNINPTADIDIYSTAAGVNTLVGINNETIFSIDLSQYASVPLGATKDVIYSSSNLNVTPPADAFIDIAMAPFLVVAYQAENGFLGGGNRVATNWDGFNGTGFVDFADGVANGFVEFTVNQTGSRTLIFRYANGSTVNRTSSVTVNGTSVGNLSFPPTGGWEQWTTISLTTNLGSVMGAKVRVTSLTTAGGPNLDELHVQ